MAGSTTAFSTARRLRFHHLSQLSPRSPAATERGDIQGCGADPSQAAFLRIVTDDELAQVAVEARGLGPGRAQLCFGRVEALFEAVLAGLSRIPQNFCRATR